MLRRLKDIIRVTCGNISDEDHNQFSQVHCDVQRHYVISPISVSISSLEAWSGPVVVKNIVTSEDWSQLTPSQLHSASVIMATSGSCDGAFLSLLNPLGVMSTDGG